MPRSLVSDGYLISIIALVKVTSLVLTMVTNLYNWCRECLQTTPRDRALTSPGRKTRNSPQQYECHYILDLWPEREATKKKRRLERSTSGGGFIPFLRGYSFPTIALANISRLLVATLTELTTKCLYYPQEVLLTVLSATRLGMRGSRVDTAEELLDDTHNHYIFDLRPEYGSDIAVMLFDVLKANWSGQISEPYYITKRRKRSKPSKFIVKCGWRRELVDSSRKKRVKKTVRPSDQCIQRDSLPSGAESVRPGTGSSQLILSREQFYTEANVQHMDVSLATMHRLEEQLHLKGPVQDCDQDIDVVPLFAQRMNYIPKA